MSTNVFDLTTAIAVYGAVLGTLGFMLSLWLGVAELRRNQPRIKVVISQGSLFGENGTHSEPMVIIEARNIGGGSQTITGVGLLLDNGNRIQIPKPYGLSLPAELPERKTVKFFIANRWVGENKEVDHIVGVFFQDCMGNLWKQRIPKKHIRKWRELPCNGWHVEWDAKSQEYYVRNNKETTGV